MRLAPLLALLLLLQLCPAVWGSEEQLATQGELIIMMIGSATKIIFTGSRHYRLQHSAVHAGTSRHFATTVAGTTMHCRTCCSNI
jgi:hypothetical protein